MFVGLRGTCDLLFYLVGCCFLFEPFVGCLRLVVLVIVVGCMFIDFGLPGWFACSDVCYCMLLICYFCLSFGV